MEPIARSPLQIDLDGAVVRPPTLIVGRGGKGSPCLTPGSSPSPRRHSPTIRLSSIRMTENGCGSPLKRSTSARLSAPTFPSSFLPRALTGRKLLPWIIFLALWTFVALQVQFSWFYLETWSPTSEEINAHVLSSERNSLFEDLEIDDEAPLDLSAPQNHSAEGPWTVHWVWRLLKSVGGSTEDAMEEKHSASDGSSQTIAGKIVKEKSAQSRVGSAKTSAELPLPQQRNGEELNIDALDEEISWSPSPESNYTIGTLLKSFDHWEKDLLESRKNLSCRMDSTFASLVHGKSFVIVLHELSLTGAPLSMLELGTKMRSCGGRVSAVVLNKQGGLFSELLARGIRVLPDKAYQSWSAAAKAELVVVGSAACAPWVSQYVNFNKRGGERMIWWIMENRRESYERARFYLALPKALLFLTNAQAMMWREWSASDGLSLAPNVEVVSLSVNEDLAFLAGLSNGTDSGLQTKLREEVRREMGLEPNDVLVASLSSINPGKGQLLFLQAALMVLDHVENEGLAGLSHVETDSALEYRSSRTSLTGRQIFSLGDGFNIFNMLKDSGNGSSPAAVTSKEKHSRDRKGRRRSRSPPSKGKKASLKQRGQNLYRKIVYRFRRKHADMEGKARLRILIGSVGCKSNKGPYLEKITKLLDRDERLKQITLSAPSTTHVAPLYAAADVYVMNAQGLGETFGRVTVEAMAFGLPILATDAGASREMVVKNVTGLVHPTGRAGVPVLAQHMRSLLDHKGARERMGSKGRELVGQLYREEIMYEKLAKKFKQVLGVDDSS